MAKSGERKAVSRDEIIFVMCVKAFFRDTRDTLKDAKARAHSPEFILRGNVNA